MSKLEVYGSKHCQYTSELLAELEWQGKRYSYHDVEEDAAALKRLLELSKSQRSIPVLVENGQVIGIGYQGRSCVI